jgi:hypothetical protein
MSTHQHAAYIDRDRSAQVDTDLPALMVHSAALVADTLELEYSTNFKLHQNGGSLLLQAIISWQAHADRRAKVSRAAATHGRGVARSTPLLPDVYIDSSEYNSGNMVCCVA